MKQLSITLLFSLISAFAYAENVTIESLIHQMNSGSINELNIKSHTYQNGSKTYAKISNKVSQIGTNEVYPALWEYEELTKSSGFKIKLGLNQYYLDPKPNYSNYPVEQCPYSMASSGQEFIRFKGGDLFQHTWSCGSVGCSFEFLFSNNSNPCGK